MARSSVNYMPDSTDRGGAATAATPRFAAPPQAPGDRSTPRFTERSVTTVRYLPQHRSARTSSPPAGAARPGALPTARSSGLAVGRTPARTANLRLKIPISQACRSRLWHSSVRFLSRACTRIAPDYHARGGRARNSTCACLSVQLGIFERHRDTPREAGHRSAQPPAYSALFLLTVLIAACCYEPYRSPGGAREVFHLGDSYFTPCSGLAAGGQRRSSCDAARQLLPGQMLPGFDQRQRWLLQAVASRRSLAGAGASRQRRPHLPALPAAAYREPTGWRNSLDLRPQQAHLRVKLTDGSPAEQLQGFAPWGHRARDLPGGPATAAPPGATRPRSSNQGGCGKRFASQRTDAGW